MENIYIKYCKYILICLLIILLVKQSIESNLLSSIKNLLATNTQHIQDDNLLFQKQLKATLTQTQNNINKACEEGFIDAMQDIQNQMKPKPAPKPAPKPTVKQTFNDIKQINNTPTIKLQLFYKPSCKYCKEFMNVWIKIINNLPNDATYEEIDCEDRSNNNNNNNNNNNKLINENNITSVPTIILLVNEEKYTYTGDRSYGDINRFLKMNGINLIQRSFEYFNDNGYTTDDSQAKGTPNNNPRCPVVSFDKQYNLENDSYMYQIFNDEGQYGYAVGGNNTDKLLTPYLAAYSTIDSYLTSLPDDKDSTKTSYKNINECALVYADNIINFGLCDKNELAKIENYKTDIENGSNEYRIANTDYTSNNLVVNAIKKVCDF